MATIYLMNQSHLAFIGIGANLGHAQRTVQETIIALGALPHTRLLKHSSLYRSEPIDASGDDYINAVAQIETQLEPLALLQALHGLEQAQGRLRPYHYAPRTLDLDILLYDQLTLQTDALTLPHPRLHLRAFVLLPLLEISPQQVIPNLGRTDSFLPFVQTQIIQKLIF